MDLRDLASHGVTEYDILEQFAMGLRIFTDAGRMWWVSDGQLQFERLLDKEEREFSYF
ncbi:hypothetical protein [Shewanella psychrophila]|uniref:hypothetical protein n=1 Tax=Shewanella psychrophila TaxID=225848 RepID=UPI001474AA81|nr:hypothetical protein [Shewanella psychrophila]